MTVISEKGSIRSPPDNTFNPAFHAHRCVSPVVVMGTVVLSMSAGRVGVTVSAGVEISTNTQTQLGSKEVL